MYGVPSSLALSNSNLGTLCETNKSFIKARSRDLVRCESVEIFFQHFPNGLGTPELVLHRVVALLMTRFVFRRVVPTQFMAW